MESGKASAEDGGRDVADRFGEVGRDVRASVDRNLSESGISANLDLPEAFLCSLDEIHLVGNNESLYASRYVDGFFEEVANIHTRVFSPSEYRPCSFRDPWGTLMVAASPHDDQEVAAAVSKAKESGVRSVVLTHAKNLTECEPDTSIHFDHGAEGHGDGFVFQSLNLFYLLLAVAEKREKDDGSELDSKRIYRELERLPKKLASPPDMSRVRDAALRVRNKNLFLFLGDRETASVADYAADRLFERTERHGKSVSPGRMGCFDGRKLPEDTVVVELNNGGLVLNPEPKHRHLKHPDEELRIETPESPIFDGVLKKLYLDLFVTQVRNLELRLQQKTAA